MRVELPEGEPDTAQLIEAVRRLRPALRPLDRDQERSRCTRARSRNSERQAGCQREQENDTLAARMCRAFTPRRAPVYKSRAEIRVYAAPRHESRASA